MFLKQFKKRKFMQLTETDLKWNTLWSLYAKGCLSEPYNTLADYCAGVNGEGHYCFFDNKGNALETTIEILTSILPKPLLDNLMHAYSAYRNENVDLIDEKCSSSDMFFYDNEAVCNKILQEYANTL